MLAYERKGSLNKVTIGKAWNVDDVIASTPCHISFAPIQRGFSAQKDPYVIKDCSVVYIVLPRYLSFSLATSYESMISAEIDPTRETVFVVNDISAGVLAQIKEKFPGVRVLEFGAK